MFRRVFISAQCNITSAMHAKKSKKCYSIVANKGRLSKCRARDKKRARERRASETAAQREVRLVKHRLQHTDAYASFSKRREACLPYCCEVAPVSTGIITDVRKVMSSTDTHNIVDQYLSVCTMSPNSLNPYLQ